MDKRSIFIRLSQHDQDEIDRIFDLKRRISASDAVTEKAVVDSAEREPIIRLGVTGEYVVAKAFGGTVVEDPHLIGGEWDVETYNGRTIEVKTTQKPGRNFILYGDDPERFKADYGVLVWRYSDDSYGVYGWITRGQWLAGYEVVMLRRPTMLYRYRQMESAWLFPDLQLGAPDEGRRSSPSKVRVARSSSASRIES